GRVTLSAHWRAEAAGSADLSVFVHLIGPDGKIAAQHDGRPCGGGCPTTAWSPGDELLDAHPVDLPAGLAPGRYRLAIGLYDPRSGVRRPRAGAPAGEPDFALADAFELPP
ncbi:MAG TPA: hypothetical protein VGL23_08245, partial [Chloroflexota bacterium]